MRNNKGERDVVVAGASRSMWKPLAKHLDNVSITFSCKIRQIASSFRKDMRACTAKCSVVRHINWFAFWRASHKVLVLCVCIWRTVTPWLIQHSFYMVHF